MKKLNFLVVLFCLQSSSIFCVPPATIRNLIASGDKIEAAHAIDARIKETGGIPDDIPSSFKEKFGKTYKAVVGEKEPIKRDDFKDVTKAPDTEAVLKAAGTVGAGVGNVLTSLKGVATDVQKKVVDAIGRDKLQSLLNIK